MKKLPLYEAYPLLEGVLRHETLGIFPTPIHHAVKLAQKLKIENLFIKCDNQSGDELPGGNKTRKLEFLLAAAKHQKATAVATIGDAGSNHALTTTVCAQQMGLKSIIMLTPQTPTAYTRRNLLLNLYFGADIRYFSSEQERDNAIRTLDPATYFIPLGGSNALGSIGFVNAAFELKQQINAGILPKPDIIYITLGSAGMAAGLMIGLKAAGLACSVIPVRVSMTPDYKEQVLLQMLETTTEYLQQLDRTFPKHEFTQKDLNIEHNFAGQNYAHITQEAAEAITLLHATEGIKLEGTYTGKTFAALIAHAKAHKLQNKTVLFWNSFSAGSYAHLTNQVSYKQLPSELHYYFTSALQPLDQGY